MKISKRLITALLALMLLSLNITGLAYYTGNTEESAYPEKYQDAINTLYGLGVLSDTSADGYENTVSRADFAAYVAALGGGRTVEIPEPAEQDITLGEAVKMLVDMTENTIRAEYYGSYPTGYLAIASRMGITHGLSGMQAYDKINYGIAVQMLYNSMRITPGVFDTITENYVDYEFDANHTVLTEYLDVKIKEGFVTADGFWSLNPGELPAADGIVIDGQEYTLKYPDVDDYVGFEVSFYYDEEEEVILAVEKSKDSEQVILDSRNVTNFRDNTYYYEIDGREKKYQLDDNVYIVSNYEANMNTSVNMYPANSDIVLVDADGNNSYETVLIKTYTEITVQSLNVDSERLSSKAGNTYDVVEEEPARVYLNGKRVDYDSVKSNMHATIVVNADNEVREIYLANQKVSGTITSYESDENETYVTIADTTYAVSGGMINRNNLGINISGEFSLNFKGEIANLTIGDVEGETPTATYGYLINLRKVDDENQAVRAKIFNADGTMASYEIIEDVKVNKKRTEESDLLTLFGSGDKTDKQLIYYTLNADNKISTITKPVAASDVAYGDHKLHVSLDGNYQYAYGIFAWKMLMKEDTVVFSVPTYENAADYDYLVGKTQIASEAYHNIKAYSYELNDSYADAVVVYRTSGGGKGGICGGPANAPDLQYGNLCLVTDVKNEYNEEYANSFDMIEYINLSTGAAGRKLLADNAAWYMRADGTKDYELISYDDGYGSIDLQAGDLFHFAENTLGEIGSVSKAYDASDRTLVKGKADKNGNALSVDYSQNPFGSFYASYRVAQGYPVSASDDSVVIAKNAPTHISKADRANLEYFNKHKQTKVHSVKVNGNNVEVKEITLADIAPSTDVNNKAVIYTSWSGLYSAVVYEYEN